MVEEPLPPLTAGELAALDAQYQPFPSFAKWPSEIKRGELWNRDLEAFRAVAEESDGDDLAKAQEVALRTAAFDTGAIEGLYPTDRGLTFTVATQAAAWEQEVVEQDANALELFKAQLEAFEMVLDLATNRFPKLTQSWIRQVHEVVTRPQETYIVVTPLGPQRQPLPKGAYKSQPNHVRTADGQVHAYAPVTLTQPEMQRLLGELESAEFQEAHPILQASYVHYALVAIHPFADGNGRLSRAVASAYTYRAASVPLLVLAHHRDLYFAALAKVDAGDSVPFVEFIARVSRDALQMVTEQLKTAKAPQPEDVLSRFRQLYVAQGELSHQQMDSLANDLVEDVALIAEEKVTSLPLPEGVTIEIMRSSGGLQEPPEGFRSVVKPGTRSIQLTFEAAPPGRAKVKGTCEFFVSTDSDPACSVLLRALGPKEEITLGQGDLLPELSSAARLRLQSFIERILGKGLDTLLRESQERLSDTGYS
jgi:Fic family protein